MNVVPSGRLLLLLLLVAPVFLLSASAALLLDILLLAAAAIDAVRGGAGAIQVRRTAPPRVSQGASGTVTVAVDNSGRRAVHLYLTDDLPPALERREPADVEDRGAERGSPAWATRMTVSGGGTAVVTYRFRAVERGTAPLGDIHLRILGPLRLVWRQRRLERADPVRVQPGLLDLRRYRLLAHRQRLREMGLRTLRERGEGGSFESLREYVRGDDPRRLDWKATGRRGTLIVRQMEVERSQNVLLAIDAGRLMTEELEGSGQGEGRRERLDSALAASLLLAEVAAQHGDRVGLFVFSDRVHSFIPPARAPIGRLADTLADVQARLVEPDYPGAFTFLSHHLRRRSLIVLFTDVIDARASAALLVNAGAATRRHLALAVAIRNPALERRAAAAVDDEQAVYLRAAAEELLQQREGALLRMRRAGVLVADSPPDEAVATTVNRYLEVKRRGRL